MCNTTTKWCAALIKARSHRAEAAATGALARTLAATSAAVADLGEAEVAEGEAEFAVAEAEAGEREVLAGEGLDLMMMSIAEAALNRWKAPRRQSSGAREHGVGGTTG
jgi:uncharacterized membrane protein